MKALAKSIAIGLALTVLSFSAIDAIAQAPSFNLKVTPLSFRWESD